LIFPKSIPLLLILAPFILLSDDKVIEIIGKSDNSQKNSGTVKTDPTGFTDVINKENFKGRYTNLTDILERETGVRIRRYGGLGSYSTLSIRGSNSNQVKIYIDGIPLNNSEGGEVNLSDLSFDNLDSIEIYKSGASSGFSSSAIGGSVNLVTEKSKGKRKSRIGLAGGSFNTIKTNISHSDSIESVQYGVFLQREKSDQNFLFQSDNGTPVLNEWDDKLERRKNAYFDRTNFTGNLTFKIRDTSISFLNDFNYRVNGLPGPVGNQSEKVYRKYLRNTTGLSTSTKGLIWENLTLNTRLFYTGAKDQLFDSKQEFSYGNPNSLANIQQFGFHFMPTISILNYNQIIRFLIGEEKETFIRDKRNPLDQIVDRSTKKFRSHTILQVQDEIRLFQSKLILLPTVQKEFYKDRFNEIQDLPTLYNTLLTNYRLPSTFTSTEYNNYRFGALYKLIKTDEYLLTMKGNISNEFRMPLFVEIFGERGSIIGNSSLKPEKSVNRDFGFTLSNESKNISLLSSLSLFQKKIYDMILMIPNSQFTLRPENIDSADIRGLELGIKSVFYQTIKVQSNYTYQRAINTSNVSYLNGKYLPLRPLHEWLGLISYMRNNFEVGGEAVFIGASFRDRTNEYYNFQEGRWIYNTFFHYSLKESPDKELSLGIEIKNILDFKTFDIVGYPLPGRFISFNISYLF
jgi:iron complex outermembrane recepter protein